MDRFWSKVKTGEPDECWEWTACRHPQGYGMFKAQGLSQWAHRIAYELTHGAAPEVVMHICDNPACCNPVHLRGGTQLENIQDRQIKARHAHKLSAEDCKTIRHLYYAEQQSQSTLARFYGVNKHTIHYHLKQGAYAHG